MIWMISLDIDTKIFNNIYFKEGLNNKKRTQIYYGGSSSGKSFFLAQRTIIDVVRGRNYLICRNVASTIKRSVFNEITKAIINLKLGDYFNINKSDLVITCTLNNSQILFAGLDDPEKIKSITPKSGVLTDIWIEEATECEYRAVKQLGKRLRGQSKFDKRLTMSFNPILQEHWLYKEYFNIWDDSKQFVESNELSILKTTYKDNKFLTLADIAGLENETDKYYYDVYTLGNWGILGNVIFKNWVVEDLTEQIPLFDNIYNGNDWGFADDPFAYIRLHLDKKRKIIYVFDELYLYGYSDDKTAEIIKEKIGNELITSDSSEPKAISKYVDLGINAIGAKKGKGSIETGIKFLKEYKIVIHKDCINFKKEISGYKYKEDKNGNALPKPVDKDNHLMDASRYALESETMYNDIWVC